MLLSVYSLQRQSSPSLRGSGLKSYLDTMAKTQGVSLLQKNELTETNIIF